MSCAIAIFVKTPGYSPVKTRVAADTDTDFAASLYWLAARASASVVHEVVADGAARGYWAVAEADVGARASWPGMEKVGQGEGSLGERMARVHTALVARHGSALLIGADSPQVEPGVLKQAVAWLADEAPRLVLGPAEDGGFWLVGANHALPLADWTAPGYSRADTLTVFRRTMARHGDCLLLPQLRDVDSIDDITELTAALQALARPTIAQDQLRAWLAVTRVATVTGDDHA